MKKLNIYIFASVWILFIVNPLYAYLDPATGSMILQLVLGAIAGTIVTVKIYWKKISAFFNKDENKQEESTDDNKDE